MMSSADFEHWEKRYAASDYLYGTEPNAFLKAQANPLPKSGKALAVADGEGRNGVWLAEQGLDVLSVDFSPRRRPRRRRWRSAAASPCGSSRPTSPPGTGRPPRSTSSP